MNIFQRKAQEQAENPRGAPPTVLPDLDPQDVEVLATIVREAIDWQLYPQKPLAALDCLLTLIMETQGALRTEVRLRKELEAARREYFADPEAAIKRWDEEDREHNR